MNYIVDKYGINSLEYIQVGNSLDTLYIDTLTDVELLKLVHEMEVSIGFQYWDIDEYYGYSKNDKQLVNEFKKHMLLQMVDTL